MIMSLKERGIKFKPRIKLNHNIDVLKFSQKKDSGLLCSFLCLSPGGPGLSLRFQVAG